MSLTARDVALAICRYNGGLWTAFQSLAALNTCGVVGWEADLLVIRPSGWIYEVEIKLTASDFRADLRKMLKHRCLADGQVIDRFGRLQQNYVRRFYYGVPASLREKIEPDLPEHAGLIEVEDVETQWRGREVRIVRPAPLLPALKAEAAQRERLLLSVYHRCWKDHNRREACALLPGKEEEKSETPD